MLHAKFQDHRTFGSGEDFLTCMFYHFIMGMAAILVMCPGPFQRKRCLKIMVMYICI